MRKVLALLRASWLEANSYRMRMLLTLVSLVLAALPFYYIAQALQSVMKSSIEQEGGQYFAFLIIGMISFTFLRLSISTLPGEIGGAISSGTLEALLGTPTRLPTLLIGMVGYAFTWAAVRCAVFLAFATIMGAHLIWARAPIAAGILLLIIVVHSSFAIMSAALILAFRASGPLESGVIWISTIFGGVYYPTASIPAWLAWASPFVPLTYGLRALRRVFLEPQMTYQMVAPDLLRLVAMGVVLLSIGIVSFWAALRYARHAGTLAQY